MMELLDCLESHDSLYSTHSFGVKMLHDFSENPIDIQEKDWNQTTHKLQGSLKTIYSRFYNFIA